MGRCHPAFALTGRMSKEQRKKEDERIKMRDVKHTAVALVVRKKFAKMICDQADIVKLAIKDLICLEDAMRHENNSLLYARDDIMADTASYGNGFVLHEALDSIKELIYNSSMEAGISSYISEDDDDVASGTDSEFAANEEE